MLPDAHTWRGLALDSRARLLDGLDGIGLDFWLEGLSPNVSPDGLERHFQGRVRALMEGVASRLPDDWDAFGAHLTRIPDIFWVAPILAGDDPGTRLDTDSGLQRAARAAPEQRRGILGQGPFSIYLEGPEPPEKAWRDRLMDSIPRLSRGEGRPVARLVRTLRATLDAKSADFEQLAGSPDLAGSTAPAPGLWRHHRSLEDRLFALLAGDPFHPALILIHALLELLAMEKLRALLLSRLLGWAPPAALTGRS